MYDLICNKIENINRKGHQMTLMGDIALYAIVILARRVLFRGTVSCWLFLYTDEGPIPRKCMSILCVFGFGTSL